MVIKRIIDIFLSIALLIILLPILAIICVLSFLFLKRPIFFVQERLGFKGRPFKVIKFRTMKNLKDTKGNLLSNKERITKYGSLLRMTSLDEIPSLINVLKGDMSLVGPRPFLPEYRDYYTAEQFRRHDMLPGITGWAQINGRNTLDWEQKFELDLWYIDHWSLALDFKILGRTIFKVLNLEGIDREGQVGDDFFKSKTALQKMKNKGNKI